jgi:hypothetical protein
MIFVLQVWEEGTWESSELVGLGGCWGPFSLEESSILQASTVEPLGPPTASLFWTVTMTTRALAMDDPTVTMSLAGDEAVIDTEGDERKPFMLLKLS